MNRIRTVIVAAFVFSIASCGDSDIADANGCSDSEQCPASAPVCDVGGTGRCTECTASDDRLCSETEPICGSDNACRGCIAHAECTESNACTPEGRCAAPSEVAYVAAGGNGTTAAGCLRSAACPTLADAVATPKQYIKIAIGLVQDDQTTAIERAVTILADPGAKLDRVGDGVILEARGNAEIKIYDLEISGAAGASQGIGISVPFGNTPFLTLNRVLIVGNEGGGIKIDGAQFDITNSVIASNGGPTTVVGGVQFMATNAGLRRFEFNTVTNNAGADGAITGVSCFNVVQALTLSNNIIFDNQSGGARRQVSDTTASANCSWRYSNIGPASVPGTGNINADPMFVRPAQNDFHLSGASPAKNAADSAAVADRDIDGDARPQGGRHDMGADEVRQ